MLRYRIPLVPGPTRVPRAVLETFAADYPASDLEPEFATLYGETEARLQRLVGASGRVAVMTGEGMVALWGALKSVLRPGDRVVAIAAGIFGEGIGSMAEGLGATVVYDRYPASAMPDPDRVRDVVRRHDPAVVTMVHCETPSGTLAPLADLCAAVRDAAPDALIYVDAVSSAAGTPVRVDDWGIALCLMGAQKALSAPPDAAMIAVSEHAWTRIDAVGYAGYDALAPWRHVGPPGSFPYTPSWHATAAIHAACGLVLDEGVEAVFQRHASVAARCRDRARTLGLELFPHDEAAASPTVTGLRVPDGWTWDRLDGALRENGVALGGNWGELAGKVFRVG
ncbi:MAG: aminotransferase class V-fold PLP-dependent enzyme, partial [Gemmatimonadota bacterium]